ncbi:MAG: hypothetical protein WKH68_12145 [Candidatus Limnocylindria bacterium]
MTRTACEDDVRVSQGQPAVCRGFFARHQTQPLQLAERLGMIEEVR